MKYAIAVSSRTGNTAMLAEAIKEVLPEGECIYCGPPDDRALEAECIFAGFWTDKGSCDQLAKEFLPKLESRKVFLFGTAGFGTSREYFQQILERVGALLPPSSTVAGTFMCQGRMEAAVRKKYEALLEQHPEEKKYADLIRNFDQALLHPDTADLEALKKAAVEVA